MPQVDRENESRDEDTAAERDQLASNLAFLIVQAHRSDQQHVDEAKDEATGSNS